MMYDNPPAIVFDMNKITDSHSYLSGKYFVIKEDDKLVKNLEKLSYIATFKENWNGYAAVPLSKLLINEVRNILLNLSEQPDLFPTARGSIQIEYELKDKSYLEFEIFEDKIVVMQILQENYDNAQFWDLSCNDIEQINEIINKFFNA